MAWLGEWYKHIGDWQHDLFTNSGILVNDTVIRCIDCWYTCIADWITVSFIDMPESVSKSCCQLPIGLYCSPSCCIIQWYASVGKQIMLSVNDMLVLLTQSFYQSPVALNCSLNHAISRRYACIAHQIAVSFSDMPSKSCYQSLMHLYSSSPSCWIIHWYALVGKRIMQSVTDMLVLLTESCYQSPIDFVSLIETTVSFTDMPQSINESCYQSPICFYHALNHAIRHWYACITDWITVSFINTYESVIESYCQSTIHLYYSPNRIVHR